MQRQAADHDDELRLVHYKSIPFPSSTMELWNRQAQGKTIVIRTHSMLPQIHLPASTLLQLISSPSTAPDGTLKVTKSSSTHYLSLSATECLFPGASSASLYSIPIKSTGKKLITSSFFHEERILEEFFQNLTKTSNKTEETPEALDFYRILLMFYKDNYSRELLLRFELLFPYSNLMFTPIGNLKLVSSVVTKRLVQKTEAGFERGFLTMDRNSRVVPLEPGDSMVYRFPIVGVWVKGIPDTNCASKTISIVHPLVWAACLQFILFKGFKERISPSPSTCSFLFLEFTGKPKFFEVACQTPPAWKTTTYTAEVSLKGKVEPIQVAFLKKDTKRALKPESSESFSHVTLSTSNSRSSTPNSTKLSALRSRKPGPSGKPLTRTKSVDELIVEQTKLIEMLQEKVLKIQEEIVSSRNSDIGENFGDEASKSGRRSEGTRKAGAVQNPGFGYQESSHRRDFRPAKLEHTMPKIHYDGSEESLNELDDSEEIITRLQMKYLRT